MAVGYPLMVYVEGEEKLFLMSAAGLSGLAILATVAIGGFWILPQMRRQSREQGKLQTLTGDLERRSQDLETAALTDALTGMHNRRFFDEAMRYYLDEFEKIGRRDLVGSVFMIEPCDWAVMRARRPLIKPPGEGARRTSSVGQYRSPKFRDVKSSI